MPHRTRGWVWAGRAVAVAVVTGLAGYFLAIGLTRAGAVAAPVGVVIALAALIAPYLLPAYQPPTVPPRSSDPAPPGRVMIIADHGSVAAQYIGEVTMHGPHLEPGTPSGRADP